MKILRLRFRNINSFYGEHEPVDFTRAPLAGAGLFIISGATGAGKSTLLDVITLALYNRVPRLAEKLTQSKIDELGSIVNRQASAERNTWAYAEVEYEAKGKQYRAQWSIEKNRNGKWRDYAMKIAELPSEVLLEVKRLDDFPKKNAELIGLDYDQFVKSIVLAQGSFAEFLKAGKNERGVLLEKITGTSIYRELGKAAYKKFGEWDTAVKLKEAEKQGIIILPDEKIEELKAQRESLDNVLKTLRNELELWTKEINLTNEIREAGKKLESAQQSLRVEENQYDQFAPNLALLNQHKSVRDFETPLRLLEANDTELAKKQTLKERLQEVAASLAGLMDTLLARGKTLTKGNLSEENFLENIEDFEKRIKKINDNLRELSAEKRPVINGIENEIAGSGNAAFQNLSTAAPIEALEEVRGSLNRLAPHLNLFPNDFDADKNIESLGLRRGHLKDLQTFLTKRAEITQKGHAKRVEVDTAESEIKDLETKISGGSLRLSELNVVMEQKEAELRQQLSRKNFEEERKQLKEGEECPLCGATHHPFIHQYVHQLIEVEEELQGTKAAQKILVTELEKLRQDHAVWSNQKQGGAKQIDQLRKELTEVKTQILKIGELVNPPKDITPEWAHDELVSLENELRNPTLWKKAKEREALLKRLMKGFEQLVETTKKETAEKNALSLLYKGNDAEFDIKNLNNNWNDFVIRRNENKTNLTTSLKEIAELDRKIHSQKESLNETLSTAGIPNIEMALGWLLRSDVYKNLSESNDAHKKRLNALKEEERLLTAQIKEKNEKQTKPEVSLDELRQQAQKIDANYKEENQRLGGLNNQLATDAENRRRHAAFEEQVRETRAKRARWNLLSTFIGDASGHNFNNFAQGLTLNNLIAKANERLLGLSDRYLLDKPRNNAQELFVVDIYQGNAERAVTTLSGGETFTVSLALALALSDLASKNVRIESLFIDEGFGTLDPETLDAAIEMLEKLQENSQKTVGVISHRQEMKDRIPVQIQVKKGIDGNSHLKLI